jgi:CheY-like chemotaxis protein
MGLSVVHGIVAGAGGTVSATSTPGAGSSFVVRLPAVLPAGSHADSAMPDGDKRNGTPNHDLRIMVVDDEQALVEMLGDALGREGFRVEGFTDALAAFESFATDPARFALVLTDITMPELRGDRLAERMKAVRADLPIVGFTGYSAAVDENRAAKAGICRLLRKPLNTDELADALRRVLLEER